jgi:hypothetical protein
MHPDKAKQAFIASRVNAASKKARSAARSATSKAKADGKPTKSIKPPKPTAIKQPTERELKAVTKKATEDFARLSLISKILQGADRERYDHFLQNGFPAWRGTGYYYSRYRPGGGTVIFGLFVFAGGAVHYLVLVLGWKRQRDFVQRYIQQARTLAWGDSSLVAGIPGISNAGESTATSTSVPQADDPGANDSAPMNRRERRAQEKAKKKPSAKDRAHKGNDSGAATPTNEPADSNGPAAGGSVGPAPGPRKRVQAENGKTLVVDSIGNVFLEEVVHEDDADSDDEGELQLFLLDADEMPRPTVRDTMVFRLPVWVVGKLKERITGSGGDDEDETTDGGARRRKKVPRKPKPGDIGVAEPTPAVSVPSVAAGIRGVASGTSSGDDEVDGFVAVGEKVHEGRSGGGKKKKGKKGR